jgi:SPP1 family predicted phage head-tail adaptor
MKTCSVGEMRHVVRVQWNLGIPTGMGGATDGWVDFVPPRRAKIEWLTGNERVIGPQLTPLRTAKITLRFFPGLTDEMRLVFEGRLLNIDSFTDFEERHRELILKCIEKVVTPSSSRD